MNLPAKRDRVSMSNRKNVIRRNPLHAQCRIDAQFTAQPSDRDAITSVEIMVLDRVGPISEHGDKAVLAMNHPKIRTSGVFNSQTAFSSARTARNCLVKMSCSPLKNE